MSDSKLARPEANFKLMATIEETDFARQIAVGVPLPEAYENCGLGKGMTRRQCWSRGAYLAKSKRIEERTKFFQAMINHRMDIREDRILSELAAIAFSDPADFLDDDGFPLPIKLLPKHARAAISVIDTGVRPTGEPYMRLRLADKLKALNQLVKIKDMEKQHQANTAPKIEIGLKGRTYEEDE
ncbi:MAG: hypothetical protein CL678_08575 [Bdellovibrionaceae bacterium]|nr:hypothetical protein [Pseudobdellovibrionaceae bacterium]